MTGITQVWERLYLGSFKDAEALADANPHGRFRYAFGASFAAAVATGAAAAFFAAAFTARFFFAQRFCCASAIFWRLSELTTRFVAVLVAAFFGATFFAAGALAAGFFSAAFLAAQRCLAASAIFFRDAALMTRFLGAAGTVAVAGF